MTTTPKRKESAPTRPQPKRPAATRPDPLEPRLRAALTLVAVLLLLVGLSPASNWTWGANLFRYYPPALTLMACLGVGLAIWLWPAWTPGAAPAAGAAPGAGGPSALRRPPIVAALAGLGALAFYQAFHAHSYLLGDGYEIIRRLRQLGTPAPRAPLYNLLAPLVFRAAGGLEPGREEMAAGVISILLGVLAVATAAFFLARMARRDAGNALVCGTLLLVTPALQLFCGYVESYPPLLAATLIFFAAAFDRLTGGGIAGLVVAALAVLAALLSHPFGLTLLPALLYLIVYRPGLMTSARLWRAAVIGAAAAAAAVALLALVFALNPGLRADNQPLRFLAPQEQLHLGGRIARHLFEHRAWSMKYGVLSWPQLADVLNGAWLVGGVGLLVVAALLTHPAGRRALLAPPALCALLALPGVLLMRCALRTPLGALRDWDLFATFGLGFSAIAGGAAATGGARRLFGPILMASLLLTLPWLGIQVSPERSAHRHFEAIEATPRPEPFIESGFHGVMGDRFGGLGNFDLAASAYRRSLDAYPRFDYAWRFGVGEMHQNRYQSAADALQQALRLHPDDRKALTELGRAWNALRRYDQADSVLARVIELYPRDAGAAMVYRARTHFGQGDAAGGRRWIESARATLPPGDVAWKDLKALEDQLARGVPADTTAAAGPPAGGR